VAAGDSEWLIDPVIIDSGLQLLILWARARLDQTPLPSSLGCYYPVLAMPRGLVRCEARIHHTPGNPVLRADLRFFGESGQLLGWMEEMKVTCSRELNRLAKSGAAGIGA
ncbi:MAG: polyketide synthase dehydratase domain-containing protein, partial [Acidobacteriota bacterium]